MTLDLVVEGASEVFASRDRRIEDGAVAVVDDEIGAVGPTDEITREYPPKNAAAHVDATGKTVLPGFVDSHTHALFAGDRSDEYAAKLRGKTYEEILAEGGGILGTVRAVRDTDESTLLANVLGHLDVMLAHGTTTVEVKSGYGLDVETELKMLDVIRRADGEHPIDVVPTFMGAHAVPEEITEAEYVQTVVDEQLPAVADQDVAEFCDVFTETDVFSVEQSRRVLEAGKERGLTPKVHAEELSHLGGTQLAAEVGAASADHLLYATDEDAEALAEASVTAVLLPGTAFSLGADYANPQRFAGAGCEVAVATDFNPNCYSQSMPMAVALACSGMGMAPADAIAAATAGGASALDRPSLGTLESGNPADFVVVDGPSHVHVPYNFGVNSVDVVVKNGAVVSSEPASGSSA